MADPQLGKVLVNLASEPTDPLVENAIRANAEFQKLQQMHQDNTLSFPQKPGQAPLDPLQSAAYQQMLTNPIHNVVTGARNLYNLSPFSSNPTSLPNVTNPYDAQNWISQHVMREGFGNIARGGVPLLLGAAGAGEAGPLATLAGAGAAYAAPWLADKIEQLGTAAGANPWDVQAARELTGFVFPGLAGATGEAIDQKLGLTGFDPLSLRFDPHKDPYWGQTEFEKSKDDHLVWQAKQRDQQRQIPGNEQFALEWYGGSGYVDMNRKLRGKGVLYGTNPEIVQDRINLMHYAIDRVSLPEHGVVYRGTETWEGMPAFAPGMEFHDPGFWSTSTDMKVASSFSQPAAGTGGRIMFRVEAPEGSKALVYAGKQGNIYPEREVIFQNGTAYKVKQVSTDMHLRIRIGEHLYGKGKGPVDEWHGTVVVVEPIIHQPTAKEIQQIQATKQSNPDWLKTLVTPIRK